MPISVLSKWGNSLALRAPKEALGNFKEGDHFDVFSDESGLRFTKARRIKKYDIPTVLESLSPGAGGEMDWGKTCGKEIWWVKRQDKEITDLSAII